MFLVRVVRTIFRGIWWMLPWVLKCLWAFLKLAVNMIFMALASWNNGLPKSADTLANNWVHRAAEGNFPSAWSNALYWVMFVAELAVIILCWLVLAHVTVALVFLLFLYL